MIYTVFSPSTKAFMTRAGVLGDMLGEYSCVQSSTGGYKGKISLNYTELNQDHR